MHERAIIILPARNEAEAVGDVLAGCRSSGFACWVLDDASTDQTREVARKAGATVTRFPNPQGKTAALRFALVNLPERYEWIVFMDADGQHRPSDLAALWSARQRAEAVLGNRMPTATRMPWLRRWTNHSMSRIINCLSGAKEPDTQCGFRLIHRSAIANWLPKGRFFEFETELYFHLSRTRARMVSVPIRTVYANERSKIAWLRDGLRFAWLLCREWRESRRVQLIDSRPS